jgi:hypothetical protein
MLLTPISTLFAGGPITLVGTNTGQNASGSAVTVNMPAGVVQNDVAVASVVHSDGDFTPALTTAGYTQAASITHSAMYQKVWYKRMGASPDSNVVATGSGLSKGLAVCLFVFRNVHQTTALDVTATTAGSSSSAAPNPPSITPSTDGTAIFIAGGCRDLGGSTPPANYSNAVSITSSGSQDAQGLAAWRRLVGGSGVPEDPAAWGGISNSWTAVTVALRKA